MRLQVWSNIVHIQCVLELKTSDKGSYDITNKKLLELEIWDW